MLAHDAREGEPPQLQRLEALVAEDVVGDRLQIRARLAEPSRAIEHARVGARELERAGVGHDPDERRRGHLRRPLDPERVDDPRDELRAGCRGDVDEVRGPEVIVGGVVVDVHERGARWQREFRAIDRAEVHGDHEIDVLGWRILRKAFAPVKKPLLLGHRVGAVPRHAFAEGLQAEAERECGADRVRIRVAMRDESDSLRAAERRDGLLHRPSRSRASRSSAEMRTACSAERS